MKKLLVASVLTVALLTAVAVGSTSAFATMDENGYAVPASSGIARALNTGERSMVDLIEVEYEDVVYSSMAGYYVGAQRRAIDQEYPVFINGGAALRFLNDDNWLISTEVDLIPTFEGLYLNDGYTYNRGLGQADAEEFIFLALSNGMYMNAQKAVFTNRLGSTDIPIF